MTKEEMEYTKLLDKVVKNHLMTKKDVAERWQISLPTVDKYIQDGILTPVKGIPSVRFTVQHIEEIEGVIPEKFSPLQRKKLEEELDEWKQRALTAEEAIFMATENLTKALCMQINRSK